MRWYKNANGHANEVLEIFASIFDFSYQITSHGKLGLIAGLIVGAFARLLVPGRQDIGLGLTIINYTLPQKFSSAQIVITDKNGKTIKAVNVSGNGKATLKVDASTLTAGAYQYSLMVDGKLISTKQMVIAK